MKRRTIIQSIIVILATVSLQIMGFLGSLTLIWMYNNFVSKDRVETPTKKKSFNFMLVSIGIIVLIVLLVIGYSFFAQ